MTQHINENELTFLIKQLDLDHLEVDSDSTHESSDGNHNDTSHQEDGWIQIENNRITVKEILVSDDKLHAYFHLKSKEQYGYQLTNQKPSLQIVVTVEEDKSIVLETVHLQDVVADLEQKSIKSNLDIAAIQNELVNPTFFVRN